MKKTILYFLFFFIIYILSFGLVVKTLNKPKNYNNVLSIINSSPKFVNKKTKTLSTLTQKDINNNKRKEMQNKYGVRIEYKDKFQYLPKNIKPVYLMDDTIITQYLDYLDTVLSYYPSTFFYEMKNNSMPLTIYLIDNAGGTFAGLTDLEKRNDIKITLTTDGFFYRTVHHEIMHYIHGYIKEIAWPNDPFVEWEKFNPLNFKYGNFDDSFVYSEKTDIKNIYFINHYAETNKFEDIASTFEEMTTRTTINEESYHQNTPIYKKEKLISEIIEKYYKSVKPNTIWKWNRFLNN
ncbi:MAG: hypothetical protein RRY22_03750 [Bacilli bacterium]